MHLWSFGLSAAMALAANAVIIPSTVSVEGLRSDPNAAPAIEGLVKYHTIQAPCPTCAFKHPGGLEGTEYHLVHKLAIDTDRNEFSLNDAPLFPPRNIPAPMYAHQVPSDQDGWVFLKENPEVQGLLVNEYAVIFDKPETVNEKGFELILLTAVLTRIEGQDVYQAIRVMLGKDVEGRLSIVNVDFTSQPGEWELPPLSSLPLLSDTVNPHDAVDAKQCHGWPLLCRMREIVSARIRKMKAAMKAHKFKPCGRPRPHRRPRPHPHQPHRRPQPHGRHRHRLHPFVKFLIVPIAGFALGLLVYFVGWAVGTSIAFVYLFFVRRRQTGYSRISLDSDDVEVNSNDDRGNFPKDVKESYAGEDIAEVEGEAPPVYAEVAAGDVKN